MIKPDKKTVYGYLFAMTATAIWSGNFIIARGLSESIEPISLAFFRWVVAVVVFIPFAIKPLIAEWDVLVKNVPYLAAVAFLGVTTFNTLIYIAGHTTTALNLSLISISFPVFIVLLSRFFYAEVITIQKSAGIVLVVTGVVLLITKGMPLKLFDLSFAVGDVWMLIAAVIFALYTLLLKHKPTNLSIWAFQLSTFILGLIFLLPFFLWEVTTTSHSTLDVKTVLAILYIGIFASLSAFLCWNKAIMLIGPSRAGMVYYTLPIFSAFSAYKFLGETISMWHVYCIILIISSNKGLK